MSNAFEYEHGFVHAATREEMIDILAMSAGVAEARARGLAGIHEAVREYNPSAANVPRLNRIGMVLGIQFTPEPVPGQYYILGPSRIAGGVALWRQRVGTTRPVFSHRRQPMFKSERLG